MLRGPVESRKAAGRTDDLPVGLRVAKPTELILSSCS